MDGNDQNLFPEIPGTKDAEGKIVFAFEEHDDEALTALRTDFVSVIKRMRDGDEELLGDMNAAEILAKGTEYADAALAIKEELERRSAADENFTSALDELADKVGLEAEATEPEDATEPEEAMVHEEPEEATEPETASAAEKPVRRPLPANRRHRPAATASVIDERGLRARVNSEEINVHYGDVLDRSSLGDLLNLMVKRNKISPGDRMIVAAATYPFPEDRFLEKDPLRNFDKIRKVSGPQALVASGGLCAPLEPIYDLPGVETTARPVRDALPSFQANRGGVQVGATPTMGTYEDAVGIVTAADNETGGSLAVKNCMRIVCPDFSSVEVDSIYQCIEADNLASRAYPELMARIDELVRAEHARLADGRILGEIRAGSTAVTGKDTGAGAIYDLLGDIAVEGAGYRSRHRMSPDARLQAFLPAWLADQLALDSARAAAKPDIARTGIEAYLERFGITVTWYLDTPLDDDGAALGTSQIFAAQAGGARQAFPTQAQWGLWAPGTWLHLDAGTLDLGVVRDSSLNSTNDFQIFAESWEQVAYVGVESIWTTSVLCANGTFGAGKDFSAVCD